MISPLFVSTPEESDADKLSTLFMETLEKTIFPEAEGARGYYDYNQIILTQRVIKVESHPKKGGKEKTRKKFE